MAHRLKFPQQGTERQELLDKMESFRGEDAQWKKGRTFSYIYYPGEAVSDLVKDAYNLFFSENALNPSAFPSLKKMETEVVAMVADLFNGDQQVRGNMTTGGTESIFMAVKAAKTWAKKHKPHIVRPHVVLPISAHPAFQKAFHYLDIDYTLVTLEENFKVSTTALTDCISDQTILIVASAPSYPQGVVDPIEIIGAIAKQKDILFHVDACVGGFMLPFLKHLGYPIPAFDFSIEGVTSISADIHKYGYAAKGASVILYKNALLRKSQFFVYTDWPGGIYGSPTAAGTRPGGSIAAAWAVLNYLGLEGYSKLAEKAMEATTKIKSGIEKMEGLKILGYPDMTILSIASDTLDIYAVGDEMTLQGWSIDRQQAPPSLHLTINQNHLPLVEEFLNNLEIAIQKAKKVSWNNVSKDIQVNVIKGLKHTLPEGLFNKLQAFASKHSKAGGKRTAAMYGMIGALNGTEALEDMVLDFLDKLNSLE